MVQVWVNVDHLDAQFLGPLSADGALKARVGAAGRFRITCPEDDHLAVLEAIQHLTVGFKSAIAHAVAVVVHCAPVPALPTVRVDHHLGVTDCIHKAKIGTQVITHVAPGMVGTVATQDCTLAMFAADALYLSSDDVERLVPADRLVARFAPVGAITLSGWIEIYPL